MKLGDFFEKKSCTVKYSRQEFIQLRELMAVTVASLRETVVMPMPLSRGDASALNPNAMLHLSVLNQLWARLGNGSIIQECKQVTYRHEEAFAFIFNFTSEEITSIFSECAYTQQLVSRTVN